MRKRANIDAENKISEKRYLSIDEAAAYLTLGKSTTRKFAQETGAMRKIGRRTIIDRAVIDNALKAQA